MTTENDSPGARYVVAKRTLFSSRYDLINPSVPLSELTQRWPDFLIVGVEKAGTTWLHRNLSCSPEIWMPLVKELHYFNEKYTPSPSKWEVSQRLLQVEKAHKYLNSSPNLSTEVLERLRACTDHIAMNLMTDDWYGGVFAFGGNNQLVGEASVHYVNLPRAVIARIIKMNPAIKIILCLRDPIDRIWSSIRMLRDLGSPEAIQLSEKRDDGLIWRFIATSNYPTLINAWRTLMGDQLKIVNFDEISREPHSVLEDVSNFLGITFDPRFYPSAGAKVGETAARDMPEGHYSWLKAATREIYDKLLVQEPAIARPWYRRHFTTG